MAKKLSLVAGSGTSYSLDVLATSDVYDRSRFGRLERDGLSRHRSGRATASLLPDGGVLVAGGRGPRGDLPTAEVYRPATGNWGATGSLAGGRRRHTATVLLDGGVLVTGGIDGGGVVSETQLYCP